MKDLIDTMILLFLGRVHVVGTSFHSIPSRRFAREGKLILFCTVLFHLVELRPTSPSEISATISAIKDYAALKVLFKFQTSSNDVVIGQSIV